MPWGDPLNKVAVLITLVLLFVGCIGAENEGGTSKEVAEEVKQRVINATLIYDSKCKICREEIVISSLREKFDLPLSVERVDYRSDKGRELLEKYGVRVLPQIVLPKEIEELDVFPSLEPILSERGDAYLLDDEQIMRIPAPAIRVLYSPKLDERSYKGYQSAKLSLVDFEDYECPYCGKFFKETLLKIEKEYIESGKLKYYFKDFPLAFHPHSRITAEAAECAGEQGKYWEMHDKLFEGNLSGYRERNLDKYLGKEAIERYAKEIGLDLEEFRKCLEEGRYSKEVEEDFEEGTELGVSGTPTFFIVLPDGTSYMVVGAWPYDRFKEIIEDALSNAGLNYRKQS